MTRHQHHIARSITHSLRPSALNFAATAALYDPGPLLQLEATDQKAAADTPTHPRGNGCEAGAAKLRPRRPVIR